MLLGALVALGVVATGVAVPMPRATADHQGFVHAVWSSGRGSILDGADQPLFLRGVQMECWLLGGGSCWGGGPTAETETYQNLAKLVGQSDLEHFRTDLYNTYVAGADVGRVAHLGFTTVRAAINHPAFH